MSLLHLDQLSVLRGACPVVDQVSLTVNPGEVVGLIGPNGAGKTTMMRGALGLLPAKGRCNLLDMPPQARARHVAWLPQAREIAWPVPVETVVALGRLPHGRRATEDDRQAIDKAIERMGLQQMRARPATGLSGGEQGRVLIARALAQDAPLLMADEPIAGLDPAAQLATMQVFRDLAGEGRAVMVALHDLGLAARYCDRLILLQAGQLVADAPPQEVLQDDNLRKVFGVSGRFVQTDAGPVFQTLTVLA